MSHYISSILIDPVVRQARRFSRPSYDSEPPLTAIRRLPRGDDTISSSSELSAAAVETNENQGRFGLDIAVEPSSNPITDSPGALSPEHGGEGIEVELRVWTDGQGLASPLRHAEAVSEDHPSIRVLGNYSSHSDDGTSSNPLYEIPESFRSTTSSFSGSTQSIVDVNMLSRQDSDPSSRTQANDRRATGISSSRGGDGSLPADDGMGHMRKRILAVQRMETSNVEKARLVHDIMTERYTSSQPSLHNPHFPRPQSPASLMSQERPFTPLSAHSIDVNPQTMSPPTSMSSMPESMNEFHLTPEDLKPSYFSTRSDVPTLEGDNRGADETALELSEVFEEAKILGCAHYRRNIKLQCSACGRWYTCRFCHDEVEEHSLNRRETKNMLCMLCGCAQLASGECIQCGVRTAWYYCSVCKLWDDDPKKSIYHCNDCGICRVGQGLGKDFYHCKTCCVCLSISIRDTHRCIERSTDCDCPICGEYMFTSPRTVVFMRCGHSIHQRCYYEHMNSSYKCPICSRSIVNMEMQFRHLERAIESQPMPPQFQDTKALVYCNDCSAKTTVKYHWLGLKCAICDSYNTAQIRILSDPDSGRIALEASEAPPSPESFTRRGSSRINSISRGRDLQVARLSHRSATSAPPAGDSQTQFRVISRRIARSESPSTAMQLSSSPSSAESSSDPTDSMDTDEDYDDVDFWGGENPGESVGWSSPNKNSTREVDNNSHNDDNNDDDDDESANDDDTDTSDDDDMEGDEMDQMEIFGHR